MKLKYIFILFGILLPEVIFSQYIENSIEVNASYNFTTPLGINTFEKELSTLNYSESFLYPNLKQNYGYNLSAYYNIKKISFGFEYQSCKFTTQNVNEQYTRYNDISLIKNSYRLSFGSDIVSIPSTNTKVTLYIKPQLSLIDYSNNIETYSINRITGYNYAIAPYSILIADDILQEQIYAPGLALSAKIASKLNSRIGLFIEYELNFSATNSEVYADSIFFDNTIRLGVTLYLFRNKRFYYN